jgi:prevent-host-death family protein
LIDQRKKDTMEQVISATEARVHFGEVMRRVVETDTPVIVERDGKAQVVVLSKKAYDTLCNGGQSKDWRRMLDDVHERVRTDLAGRPLPDPAEVIRQMREERDEYLAGLR